MNHRINFARSVADQLSPKNIRLVQWAIGREYRGSDGGKDC